MFRNLWSSRELQASLALLVFAVAYLAVLASVTWVASRYAGISPEAKVFRLAIAGTNSFA